ncbi:MAG: GNAT family N-acetyltransferase [Erysipelotrichaceae bacterium]|nr:GNAT family N-acetyltransferase [Erysipelotrichaceae bacterium]
MKNIEILKLSQKYTIRKLTESDINLIYDFCSKNKQFYLYCGKDVSKESILNDIHITPPDIPMNQKHYIGFFEENTMIALMDLIDGYPDEETAFIGFFMVKHDLHNQGIGTAIITELSSVLADYGFTHCRLGIDQNNPFGLHFWKKNDFKTIQEVQRDNGVIVIAQKELNL